MNAIETEVKAIEKKLYTDLLVRNHCNIKRSAAELQMDRRNFKRKLRSLGIATEIPTLRMEQEQPQ